MSESRRPDSNRGPLHYEGSTRATEANSRDETACKCHKALSRLNALYSSRGAPILRSDFATDLRWDYLGVRSGNHTAVAITGHGPESVYRLFTPYGLGYVGIAKDWRTRVSHHRATKPWWHEIIGIAVHHVSTREEAVRLEAYIIERYEPPFNIARYGVKNYLEALVAMAEAELERLAAEGEEAA